MEHAKFQTSLLHFDSDSVSIKSQEQEELHLLHAKAPARANISEVETTMEEQFQPSSVDGKGEEKSFPCGCLKKTFWKSTNDGTGFGFVSSLRYE